MLLPCTCAIRSCTGDFLNNIIIPVTHKNCADSHPSCYSPRKFSINVHEITPTLAHIASKNTKNKLNIETCKCYPT